MTSDPLALGQEAGRDQTAEARLRVVGITLLALAACLGVAGGTWDAAWHVTLRRESFWSPPHLLLYAGTALALVASLAGLLGPLVQARSAPGNPSPSTGEGREGVLPRPARKDPGRASASIQTLSVDASGARRLLTLEPGFAIAAAGALVVIGSAPLDELWHRTFGADVDVWSFPHLVALAGGAAINVGSIVAVRGESERGRGGPTLLDRAELVVFLAALLWVAMFGLNWYTLVLARVRDSMQYPVLAALVAPPVLLLASAVLGRGGAPAVAAAYMGYTALAHWLLSALGYALLPFPPVLLLPALAVDALAAARPRAGIRLGIEAGLAFVPLFYLAEAASLAWYPHPGLPPPRSEIALSYFRAAVERPWDVEHVGLGMPLAAVAALVGSLFGLWFGRTIRRLSAVS